MRHNTSLNAAMLNINFSLNSNELKSLTDEGTRQASAGRRSFLKKRTKKLLLLGTDC
jgi:hypothetical protein